MAGRTEMKGVAEMKCPFCEQSFHVGVPIGKVQVAEYRRLNPAICSRCLELFFMDGEVPRKPSEPELESVKQTPIWRLYQYVRDSAARHRLAAHATAN